MVAAIPWALALVSVPGGAGSPTPWQFGDTSPLRDRHLPLLLLGASVVLTLHEEDFYKRGSCSTS